jgi:hypothetical protein
MWHLSAAGLFQGECAALDRGVLGRGGLHGLQENRVAAALCRHLVL